MRAPLAVLAQDIASNIAQVASAVIKSAGKLSLEAQRSQRLQQGLHGLRISVPLLCAICAVGALRVVEWGGVSE